MHDPAIQISRTNAAASATAKLEYFLNSEIIGDRIKNPMWLTLIGLILGEKLMGIPGMILAPVVLHYIKMGASRNKADDAHMVNPVSEVTKPNS